MRPRKRVNVKACSESTRQRIAFALDLWHYCVTDEDPHATVIERDGCYTVHGPRLNRQAMNMEQLRELLRQATVLKRGPKPAILPDNLPATLREPRAAERAA